MDNEKTPIVPIGTIVIVEYATATTSSKGHLSIIVRHPNTTVVDLYEKIIDASDHSPVTKWEYVYPPKQNQ